MNLTDKQWGLIEALVSNFESTGGAEFCFTRSANGSGLTYEGPASVAGVYDDTDLHQLEREQLITLISDPPRRFRGKLTQLGITMAARRSMQQFFRTLTVTPIPNNPKPVGMQVVHLPDIRRGTEELESKYNICMEMDPIALIIEHPDFPLKPYVRERVKNEISGLEKKFSIGRPDAVFNYFAEQALGSERNRQRQEQEQRQRRQDVVEYFCAMFCVYVRIYLDLGFGFEELSMLLPSLYDELLKQTFMLRWPHQQANDRESEKATFTASAAEYVSQSVKSTTFVAEFHRLFHRIDYTVPDNFSIHQLMKWFKSREAITRSVQTAEKVGGTSEPDAVAPKQGQLTTPPVVTRGPKADYATAIVVAEIIRRIAVDSPWRSRLDEICCELDDQNIPRPKPWKKRGYNDWSDCLLDRRDLVEKAIAHHLELARRHGEIFS